MTREQILDWMRAHRECVRGDPEQIVGRAESEARHHVTRHAWLHAKEIAEREAARWRHCSPGSHAAEHTVAYELCIELARDLRENEPLPDVDEAALLDPETLEALSTEARAMLHVWLGELAGEEEHRVWNQVVRFTRRRPQSLIREGAVSTASGWELTSFYGVTAARLAAILAHDYEEHAQGA